MNDTITEIQAEIKRQASAREALAEQGPRALLIRATRGGTTLVHASTAGAGWQATFLDEEGEPFAHIEDRDWAKLIGRLRWYGLDWMSASSPTSTSDGVSRR